MRAHVSWRSWSWTGDIWSLMGVQQGGFGERVPVLCPRMPEHQRERETRPAGACRARPKTRMRPAAHPPINSTSTGQQMGEKIIYIYIYIYIPILGVCAYVCVVLAMYCCSFFVWLATGRHDDDAGCRHGAPSLLSLSLSPSCFLSPSTHTDKEARRLSI